MAAVSAAAVRAEARLLRAENGALRRSSRERVLESRRALSDCTPTPV